MYRLISYSFCLLVAGLVFFAFSPRGGNEVGSEQINLSRIQVNDLVNVNGRLVAVGERGTIVVSENSGRTWETTHRDGEVPVTLTDITALTDKLLLAVGHDSVILRSTDAGLSWELIRRDSELGEPLLGSWSEDGTKVFAYGSFGKFLVSRDGGKTFDAQELPIHGEHLSAMAGDAEGTRIMVGEMGLVMRSRNGGSSWEKLESFYNGSLFGVAYLNDTRWIAYGMRGHVFFSEDSGDSWEQVDVGSELPLYGHAVAGNGKQMVIVGTAGFLVSVNDRGELLETANMGGLGTLTSAVILPSGEIFVAGQRGLKQSSHALVAAWNK